MRARALLGLAGLALAGCTAVPSHSAPQVITSVPFNAPTASSSHPPPPGASPREIVQDFLNVSAADAGAQSSAREYLTRSARSRWSDGTVTIVDSYSVGNYAPPHPTLSVHAREIGSLNEQGIFSPTLDGTGNGGNINAYPFRIKKVHGQFRIDGLPQGLLLTLDQFANKYTPHTLRFYDLAERYLIPDLRYSPLHDEALATWLVDQLATGPRDELQKAVSSGVLPNPTSGPLPTVELGDVTKIEIAGSSIFDPSTRDHLAAQISQTLVDVIGNGTLSIIDGRKQVKIPAVQSDQFVPAQFDNALGPAQPPPELFYVRGGRVVDEKGAALTGPGVDGTHPLSSVALTDVGDPNSLAVAGTVGKVNSSARLWVGTQQLGLRSTDVQGPLTRPAWAPGRPEVWIGDGATLFRVSVSGVAGIRHRVPLRLSSTPNVTPPIRAVRISPDGSRIALVLGERGASQLYEGVIVRTAGQVRVDNLTQISPTKVVISDVAWNDPTKLFAIGYLQTTLDARVCETNVDGSAWSMTGVPGLPSGPDFLTVTANAEAWVSVPDPTAPPTVWQQSGSFWVSPSGTGADQVTGTTPVYLE